MSRAQAQREYRQYVESEDEQIEQSRETVLMLLLTRARGYDNRVSAKYLARRTTVGPSTVRDIVRELQEEFGVPVAGLQGYFVIESSEGLTKVLDAKRQEIATRKERMQSITAAYNGGSP